MVSLLILQGMLLTIGAALPIHTFVFTFSRLLAADRDVGLLTFLRKCFGMDRRYGSRARSAGRLARATVAIALLPGAIEVIQIHVPGTAAEITGTVIRRIARGRGFDTTHTAAFGRRDNKQKFRGALLRKTIV
jgi:hypothetical protein